MPDDFLPFKITPHILEDLGVNLYTSLSKAIIEFVANAHDADADWAKIALDFDRIELEREVMAAKYKAEVKAAVKSKVVVVPLESRTLADDLAIVIEDNGHGMGRADLEHKFLMIGRRRRKGEERTARSPGKRRVIMGRKGLGKLAGFGLAHKIEVFSKLAADSFATKITLRLDELLKAPDTTSIKIPVERVEDGAGFEKSGTRIVMSQLVYDALKANGPGTITKSLGDHFYFVNATDFTIFLNDVPIAPPPPDFAFAYPVLENQGFDALAEYSFKPENSEEQFTFRYRLRFRGPKKQLSAKERGVRVYAHNRLAAAPDLLDVSTSANGFQYSSYLDGVAVADFIDDAPTDYIATDRQSLRWETPLLSPMRSFLTEQILKALNAYDAHKRAESEKQVNEDVYTKDVIEKAELPKHRETTAFQIAKTLAARESDGVSSDFYKQTLVSIVSGLGHGNILHAIYELSRSGNPQLPEVIAEITRLTKREFDEFLTVVNGRLRGIEVLKRICQSVNFKGKQNEKPLHTLFKNNPWMLDPTFFEFLTSDVSQDALNAQLTKHLGIGTQVPGSYDPNKPDEIEEMGENRRPDLVFLLSNQGLKRVVIIEFKSPNLPLHIDHLIQLEDYMSYTEDWLRDKYKDHSYRVEGILVGSHNPATDARKVYSLNKRIEKDMGPTSRWKVYDIVEVLTRTEDAHRALVKSFEEAAKEHGVPVQHAVA